jgi:hypothetical protein
LTPSEVFEFQTQAGDETMKTDLFVLLIVVAEQEIENHIEEEEGVKCFNLCTYVESLGSRVDSVLSGKSGPVQDFALNGEAIARFLWCCIATKELGGLAYPNTVRGMPVLD